MPVAGHNDRTADALGERIEALASALRGAGVDPNTAARLLGTAAAAALDSVALDLLLEEAPPPGRAVQPAERLEDAIVAPLAA